MASYIVRRLGGALIVVFGISVVTFLLVYAIPSDPARIIAGQKATHQVLAQIRHNLGLDQPLPLQYLHYLWNLLHGNLGVSYIYNQPVALLIGQRLGPTLLLALGCWIAELVIGIPLGIYTARRARKKSDLYRKCTCACRDFIAGVLVRIIVIVLARL